MKRKIDKIANELKDTLKKSFKDFKGLYLYGSQVNGEQHKDSDVDVIVIFDNYNIKKMYIVSSMVSKIECSYNHRY